MLIFEYNFWSIYSINLDGNMKLGFRFRYSVVKVPQQGDNEGTFSSSSQAATCYYLSNHLKV